MNKTLSQMSEEEFSNCFDVVEHIKSIPPGVPTARHCVNKHAPEIVRLTLSQARILLFIQAWPGVRPGVIWMMVQGHYDRTARLHRRGLITRFEKGWYLTQLGISALRSIHS